MPRRSIEQQLAQLEAKKTALIARHTKAERAKDTRRKILLGALVLQRLETSKDEDFSNRLGDWLSRELPVFLTRDADKALLADLIGGPTPVATQPVPPGTPAVGHAA